MALFQRDDVRIHFDDEGDGFPILLIAAGGMRSHNALWENAPWNPRTALAGEYRLIGMDQRNAGESTAPVSGDDGWAAYTADQLALLDHLGIDDCHVIGMCIGGPYVAGMLKAAPERFRSAVMLQPVGIEGNRPVFYDLFDDWAEALAPAHPEADEAAWTSYRSNMWDGEFMLTATTDDLESVETPILVLRGDDIYHPSSTSHAVAAHAPNATLVEEWKEGDELEAADTTIRGFLTQHSPGASEG
ncbi:MAG: alpha/beta hydrolase [Hyphomicrobiales bacterium]|nr:alpha/beta hydrolase [Hyphomicrobiales bacterium]